MVDTKYICTAFVMKHIETKCVVASL